MSSLSSMARRKKVEEFRDPLNEGVDASGGRGILDGVEPSTMVDMCVNPRTEDRGPINLMH